MVLNVDICQEGSKGYIWHLWDDTCINFTSMIEYLRPLHARQAAIRFCEFLSMDKFEIRDGRKWDGGEFRKCGAYIYKYDSYGWAAMFVLYGPMTVEATTRFYKRKKDLVEYLKSLNDIGYVMMIDIDRDEFLSKALSKKG